MKLRSPMKIGSLPCLILAVCVEFVCSAHTHASSSNVASRVNPVGLRQTHTRNGQALIVAGEDVRRPANSTKIRDEHISAVASLPIPALGFLSMLASFFGATGGSDIAVAAPVHQVSTGVVSQSTILYKAVIGLVLLLPSLPHMIKWKMAGRPPHPFLLSENAVDWPNWVHDAVQISAIIGLDLMILAGLEWDWGFTIAVLRGFLFSVYGLVGFGLFMYSVMSSSSAYSDESLKNSSSDEASAPLVAESQYQDVGLSLPHLIVVVLAQSILIGMYMKEMVKQVDFSTQVYRYWAIAIPMQIIAREMMGRSFCAQIRLWNKLLHSKDGDSVQRGDDDNCKTYTLRYADVLIRSIMSYYANCLCMATISFTLPVFMMSAASDIDFVKDCFAVVFITTLDDMGESVPLKLVRGVGQRAETSTA